MFSAVAKTNLAPAVRNVPIIGLKYLAGVSFFAIVFVSTAKGLLFP